jgi:hypothetical protein
MIATDLIARLSAVAGVLKRGQLDADAADALRWYVDGLVSERTRAEPSIPNLAKMRLGTVRGGGKGLAAYTVVHEWLQKPITNCADFSTRFNVCIGSVDRAIKKLAKANLITKPKAGRWWKLTDKALTLDRTIQGL